MFPLVAVDESNRRSDGSTNYVELVGSELTALEWLVLATAEEPQRVFYRQDSSGGHPAHALLISNTPAAIKLVLRIFERWPRLMTLTHGRGPFQAENSFHILAANRRENDLIRALGIARLRLTDNQYATVLNTQVKRRRDPEALLLTRILAQPQLQLSS